MKVNIFSKIIILSLTLNILNGCQHEYEKIHSEIVVPNPSVKYQDTIIRDSVNNFYITRLFKTASSGMEFKYIIPEKSQNKELCVVFSGHARTNYAYSTSAICFGAFNNEGRSLFWNVIKIRNVFLGINTWSAFRDSLIFPADFLGNKYTIIKGFPFLGESLSENFDVDTMFVEIREIIN